VANSFPVERPVVGPPFLYTLEVSFALKLFECVLTEAGGSQSRYITLYPPPGRYSLL
jgi:hypothetical protein